MGAPQIVEQVFEVIEGGANLGPPAKIIQFTTDNGAKTYDVVQKTYRGDNGTGFNYWVVAFQTLVEGVLTAVSAGAAFLTMEVGVVGVAVGPALGLTTGYLLYKVKPSFWNSVAEKLIAAGETIGGKVVVFMNANGTLTYSKETIEIYKNAFLESGVFEGAGGIDTEDLPFTIAQPFTCGYQVQSAPQATTAMLMPFISGLYNPADGYRGSIVTIGVAFSDLLSLGKVRITCKMTSATDGIVIIASDTNLQNNRAGMYYYTDLSWAGYQTPGEILQATYQNKKVYYCTQSFSTATKFLNYTTYYKCNPQNINDDLIAWAMIYGEPTNTPGVQDGAIVPDDEEFPLRYPKWFPFEFPDTDGQQLPDRYPLEYPDKLPKEEPYQEPAQDPEQEPDPAKKTDPDKVTETIEDTRNSPEYHEKEQPEEEEDPDIDDEDEEEIPNPDPEDPVPPDPIDPNPDPEPEPPIPVPPLPDSVSSSKLFTVYNPTGSQLDALGAYLWDSDLMEILKKIWQNPLDGIISLSQVYVTPPAGSSSNIILGYLDSGVSAAKVTNQFVTLNCGNVQLSERKNNATDYAPYTSLHIYLPFIGITELDVNECMNSTINVTYKIDLYTGTCLATIKITREIDMPDGGILYTFNGNCSQQLPLTSGDASGLLSGLLGAVGAGLSVAAGGGLGLVAGASMIGNSLNHEMLHVSHSGNISANSGIMGNKKPYLIIGRTHGYDANNYKTFYGYPANNTVYLNNVSGFTRCKHVHLKTSATDTEREEMTRYLTEGVIL